MNKHTLNRSFQIFLGGVAFFFGLFLRSSNLSAAPHVEIAQPVWNFGAVTNLAELTHDFLIRNSGDAPLEIIHVQSSCSACLRARIEQTNISAGSTTVLHSHLDLRLLAGDITRSILVDCNDPHTPSFVLGLSGLVVPAYQLTPPELALDLSSGQRSGTIGISPLVKLHADLSRVICADTNIETTISPKSAAGYLLTVRVKENRPRGTIGDRMTVCSADSNDPPCHLTVLIRNPLDLELLPDELRFLPQAEPQMRILWLKQHGATPLILLDIIPPSANFKCEIEPDSTGGSYRIYVSAWRQESAAGQTNVLVLKMLDQNQNERSVPVPIVVTSAGE